MILSDYLGEYTLKVEKAEPVSMSFTSDDFIDGIQITGGELSERINRMNLSVKRWQQVEDSEVFELVDIDVSYPEDLEGEGGIYDQWLSEDGGRRLAQSESMPEITSADQGLYHAAVKARLARSNDECEVSLPPISWLLEPGDVIELTDENTVQDARQWRIKEMDEDEGQATLTLIHYDPAAYSPDLSAVPDGDVPSERPDIEWLDPVTNLSVEIYSDSGTGADNPYHQGVVTWDESTSPVISHYQVKLADAQTGTTIYTVNEPTAKHYLKELTNTFEYVVMVDAVSLTGFILRHPVKLLL
ncbi:hypothetical protein JCM19232_2648 [Vibrio ishigakensis]|uniref:Tip attachment protein J domain-containing protein n=1 Tax=Vibrio ishigakensis TaxID=1481914 RepID=A0A0B8PKM9_9VIBR|nr:hypothetical protein JCM19232_2648 [Vibrio ishigakensis]